MLRVRFLRFVLTAVFLAGAVLAPVQWKTHAQQQTKIQAKTAASIKASPRNKPTAPLPIDLTQTPLVFEPNRGQAAAEYQWIARGAGFRVGLTSDGAVVEFRDRMMTVPTLALRRPYQAAKASVEKKSAQSDLVKLRFAGGGAWNVVGTSPTGGISNYFIGNKPANWQLNIPHYAQVKVTGVYKGIDLVLHGHQSALRYDFVVAPGADPRQIELQFEGAGGVRVEKDSGDLVLSASSGSELRHAHPRMYQESGGKKRSVQGGFENPPGRNCGVRG